MKAFIIKAVLFITIILSVIFLTDRIVFLNPDIQYLYIKKKWDYFYHYSKRINFDILLVGNSHLFAGIEPKSLCNILGVNAILIGAPGTYLSDNYFSLKEALTRTKPKLVIIETFTIQGGKSHSYIGEPLSMLFKSFSIRKNFIIKLMSTPFLFKIDNYPFAWSNTVRNHQFLIYNYKQVETNLDNWKKSGIFDKQNFNSLYLGETNMNRTGLKKNILKEYPKKGAPIDGSELRIDDESVFYLEKIKKLCKDNNIQLMFLTLPVYQKSIKNYDIWKNVFTDELSKIGKHWLNMQEPENYTGFTEISFENTYTAQHMTINGSIEATYKLAEFIQKTYSNLLPDRRKDSVWINLFYGDEGYFENNSPLENDKNNSILLKDVQFENIKVLEADLLRRNKYSSILIKISKENLNEEILKKSELNVEVEVNDNNIVQKIELNIPYDNIRTPEKYAIFQTELETLNINKIINIKLITL